MKNEGFDDIESSENKDDNEGKKANGMTLHSADSDDAKLT